MKQSGTSTLFVLVCIAVLIAAYGIGLGIRKVRFAGSEAQASTTAKPEEPADTSTKDPVAADTSAASEPSEEAQEEQSQDEEQGEPDPERERPEGRRMMGEGMRERFQNMSEEERQEAMAQMRERFGGRGRGEGRGGFSQLSEEDRDNLRAEMEELGTKAGEMSEEEMRQARSEILEKYGITPRAGGGGRRPGGRQ